MKDDFQAAHFLIAEDVVVFAVEEEDAQAVAFESVIGGELQVRSGKREEWNRHGKKDGSDAKRWPIVVHVFSAQKLNRKIHASWSNSAGRTAQDQVSGNPVVSRFAAFFADELFQSSESSHGELRPGKDDG